MKLQEIQIKQAKGEVTVWVDGAVINISTRASDDYLVAVNRHNGSTATEKILKQAPKA